jgi:hypothetical protein
MRLHGNPRPQEGPICGYLYLEAREALADLMRDYGAANFTLMIEAGPNFGKNLLLLVLEDLVTHLDVKQWVRLGKLTPYHPSQRNLGVTPPKRDASCTCRNGLGRK